MYYTGIGSRTTPNDVMLRMFAYASIFKQLGYTLRSGGSKGADTAFELGSGDGDKEIYLPWEGFNNNPSPFFTIDADAFNLAIEVYGNGMMYAKPSTRNLLSRNVYQVLGLTLDVPSEFVVCWTPDGCEKAEDRTRATGGTGVAIALASMRDIPVFNLKNGDDRLQEFIGERHSDDDLERCQNPLQGIQDSKRNTT